MDEKNNDKNLKTQFVLYFQHKGFCEINFENKKHRKAINVGFFYFFQNNCFNIHVFYLFLFPFLKQQIRQKYKSVTSILYIIY